MPDDAPVMTATRPELEAMARTEAHRRAPLEVGGGAGPSRPVRPCPAPRSASVAVDLLSARRDDVPPGPEGPGALPSHRARLGVVVVVVERVTAVGDLTASALALGGPELRG